MINKIIHCGMFGGYELSRLNMLCMGSWQAVLTDWTMMIWTDKNMPQNEFTSKANPINLSNYMKYWTIKNHGGVFMDFDVEVIKPFDTAPRAFVGFQKADDPKDAINTAVIGSEKGGRFVSECLDIVDLLGPEHAWPVDFGCGVPTAWLYDHGMNGVNVEQVVSGVTVYSKERFYPWGYQEPEDRAKITDKTFSVHHWESSWKK